MSVPGKRVQNGNTYEFDYMRVPDTRTRWEILRDGVYNPTEGTICGHTKKKWGVTVIFYISFYSGLALLFAISMKGLMATISYERPKWILESSIIGTNPGLGFRPMPDNADERSLIWYSASNASEVQTWIRRLDNFLDQYLNSSHLPNEGRNQQICNYDQPPKPGSVCAVEVNTWGPCSSLAGYGFNHSSPCIFIKLNRIYGWVPAYYNEVNELPIEMPETLVEHIRTQKPSWRNTVWVTCKPENPHDHENIGPLEYYPKSQGFPGYYFPYENKPGYLSPVVAVHFVRPKKNVVINVECRAWAKNIEYGSIKNEKMGAVHFELMID